MKRKTTFAGIRTIAFSKNVQTNENPQHGSTLVECSRTCVRLHETECRKMDSSFIVLEESIVIIGMFVIAFHFTRSISI